MISRMTLGMTLALALPLAAQAQTTYKRTEGDTLRYRVVIETQSEGGRQSMQGHQEATLAITFTGGDNAQASYEAFSQTGKFGGREITLPPEAMVNKPGTFQLAEDGTVQLGSPLPQPPGGASPLARLFLQLPSQPLVTGVEWADTTAQRLGMGAPELLIVKLKVVKDSTGPGGKYAIIEAKGSVSSSKTAAEDGGAQLQTRNTASEKGRIVFAVDQGRLVSWDRTLEISNRMQRQSGRETITRGRPGADARPMNLAPDARPMEMKTETHTLIQLLAPGEAKAAPAR